VTKHKSEHAKPHAETADLAAETAKPQAAGAELAAETVETQAAAAGEDTLAQLQGELQAAKDRELRVHAELDNYRKRAARELEDRSRYANMGLLRDLLPVLDNVERAIQAAENNADAAAILDGFRLVQQQLEDALGRHHCTRIEALHQPFDPHVHHAVMQQPSEEFPANTVLMVTQNGYQLHDRVVRPSQVIVSKPQ
jgi:molecular chaperone GrpE